MKYHANVSFHGVTKIELGPLTQHSRGNGENWQALTMYLYNDRDIVDSITFFSPDAVEPSLQVVRQDCDNKTQPIELDLRKLD